MVTRSPGQKDVGLPQLDRQTRRRQTDAQRVVQCPEISATSNGQVFRAVTGSPSGRTPGWPAVFQRGLFKSSGSHSHPQQGNQQGLIPS